LDYIPKLQVNIGQFKLPLSLEGLQSSGELDTVERALFASDRARGGTYGDVRDIGFMARGSVGRRVDFQAGVFNGVAETQNDLDHNRQKALAGRLVVRPATGLQVGLSAAWGSGDVTRPRRERLGAEFQFTHGALRLKSELMTGEDGLFHRRGFYGHVGYRFWPRVEAILRVDRWDPDTASQSTPASVSELDYVTGFNVFLTEHHLKLQVNYLRKTFGSDILASRNVLLVNTQAFW
jgi:Phosphate-selective porin O and P